MLLPACSLRILPVCVLMPVPEPVLEPVPGMVWYGMPVSLRASVRLVVHTVCDLKNMCGLNMLARAPWTFTALE